MSRIYIALYLQEENKINYHNSICQSFKTHIAVTLGFCISYAQGTSVGRTRRARSFIDLHDEARPEGPGIVTQRPVTSVLHS
jgi:hypothetical protein